MTKAILIPRLCSRCENGLDQAPQGLSAVHSTPQFKSKDLCAEITVGVHIASGSIISIQIVELMTMLAESIPNASHAVADD